MVESKIENLIIGKSYTNAEIMTTFKVANTGGIRSSNKTNTIVLFSSHYLVSKNAISYQDEWINGVLHYTGQGKEGDQKLTRNNKSLAESRHNKRKIHLFECFDKGNNIYRGLVELKETPYIVKELDFTGNKRAVYKFPLTLVEKNSLLYENIIVKLDKKESAKIAKITKKDIERFAKEASRHNEEMYNIFDADNGFYQKTISKTFDRNHYIAEYVKDLSNGVCALCEQPAPFKDKHGKPFLHSHHIQYLSQGGKDIISNCIAVCPNCHAKIHTLDSPKDKEKLLNKVKSR